MKYKLDLDESLSPFEGWAFVHFRTHQPGYALADTLNRLYDYHLARMDDININGIGWPFYHHEDSVGHLIYFLVERPSLAKDAPWDPGDKLLVIKGENASMMADYILDDFTSPQQVDQSDLLAIEHARCLENLLADFTIATEISFDNPSTSRKAQKETASMQQCCETILACIEQRHLDLSLQERLRMDLEYQKNNFAD